MPEGTNALAPALQRFHAGDMAGAMDQCRNVLATDARNAEALHLLGVILHRGGDNVMALQQAERAAAAAAGNPIYLNTQGYLLRLLGRYGEAIQKLREAIAAQADYADAYNNLGIALAEQNDAAGAESAYRAAIRFRPAFAEAWNNLGNLLFRTRRAEPAMQAYDEAVRLRPDYAEAHSNRGDALTQLGRHEDAAHAFRKATEHAPKWAEGWSKLGNALFRLNRNEDSIVAYQRCIDLNPGHIRCLCNLGAAYEKQLRYEDAAVHIRQALILAPNDITALKSLGHVLLKLGQPAEAAMLLRKASDIAPGDPDAHYSLGNALLRMERLQDAMECYVRVRQLQPGAARGYFAPASVLLLNGQYKEGWAAYESRFDMGAFKCNVPKVQERLWDGSPLNGRALLVHVEQGFGDTIQFIRYLPLLSERKGSGGKVILLCEPELERVLRTVKGWDEIHKLGAGGEIVYDVQIPLLSLPSRFGTVLENLPAAVPYLRVPEGTRAPLERPDGTKLAVGFVWAGRPTHSDDRYRSIPLKWFTGLMDVPGAHFYSLQWGARGREAQGLAEQGKITDLSSRLTDFAETMATIEQLDLVIACDTAVAHLAGALGKPVWVLLPYGAEWRWMLRREDSPWYPTMRLFRQRVCGDWRHVFLRARNALVQTVGD